MMIFVEDTAGNRFEVDLDDETPIADIVADFFDYMAWPKQDGRGRNQRAVIEVVQPPDANGRALTSRTRLGGDQTLRQAAIGPGNILRIYPESIGGGGESDANLTPGQYSLQLILLQANKALLQEKSAPADLPVSLLPTLLENAEAAPRRSAILSKRNRQLLPNHFTLERAEIESGDTLLVGEERLIFDLLPFLGQLDSVPNEIVLRGYKHLLTYLRSLTSSSDNGSGTAATTALRPLNECKLVFVGNGEVGKTSLIRWLTEGRYRPDEPKTEKIAITRWDLETPQRGPVKLNIWDFAGQEINHSVHQLFMTTRSVYVLVTNPRADGMFGLEQELNYWLELIANLAPDAPVIVALHKCEVNAYNLAKGPLCEKFPVIAGFVETSCVEPRGLRELTRLITQTIEQLPHLNDRLPQSYFEIKERLTEMADDVIEYHRFLEICRSVEPDFTTEQAAVLARLLHDLGIMLDFSKYAFARENRILNPEWITHGIYAIINAPALIARKGVLTFDELSAILEDAGYRSQTDREFLVELMVRFQLCFRVDGGQYGLYYFPTAFSKDKPAEFAMRDEPGLCFQLQYSLLPPFLISTFIIKNKRYLKADFFWRDGCILQDKEENLMAFIESNPLANTIAIEITGSGNRRSLLSFIRKSFAELNESYPRLSVGEMIPLQGSAGPYVSYEKLMKYVKAGKSVYFDDQTELDYPIAKLIGLIVDPYGQQKETLANRLSTLTEKLGDSEALRTLLTRGEIDEVFAELHKMPDLHASVRDELLMLGSRYSAAQKQSRLGTISVENLRIEINQIRYALINLIDKS